MVQTPRAHKVAAVAVASTKNGARQKEAARAQLQTLAAKIVGQTPSRWDKLTDIDLLPSSGEKGNGDQDDLDLGKLWFEAKHLLGCTGPV